MISKRDVQLGKIALKEGFISKEQLTKCLALKKKLAKEKGKKVALGALLLKKGYLDKDQLEECVKLHNAALEKAGEKGEKSDKAKKRKKRRSKRVAKADEEGEGDAKQEDASEEVEAPAKAKKKSRSKKKKSGGDEVDEVKASTATATKEAAKKSSKSKRSRRSKRASRSGRSRRSRSQDEGDPIESAIDAVDPAIFASAMETEEETDTRRLIACPECGKKYRVKRNQVGRRFSCRRCEHRIKVPKDLFIRDSEVSEVHAAVEVEEFVLGSGDFTSDEESEGGAPAKAPPKRGRGAAKKGKGSLADVAALAAKTVDKVGNEPSIADLAAQAADFKAKPLAPKTKFGAKELVTMLVSAGALAGLIFGSYQFFVVMPAAEEARKREARLAGEFTKKFKEPLDQALAGAAQALEKKDPRALGNARQALGQVARMDGLLGEVKSRAVAYAQKHDVESKLRDYMVTEGRLYLERGGLQATRGLEVLSDAIKLPGVSEEVVLEVARIQIRHRQFATAIEVLGESKSPAAQALIGLAWERGGVAGDAARAYNEVGDPLGPVLTARAHLAEGNPKAAILALQKVSGLEGLDQAAALVVEGMAHAADGNAKQASAVFDRAVAAGGESPVPHAARAEFHLAQGKLDQALEDAKRSACPRGILAKGDVFLARLELDRAVSAYREAAAADPREPKRLVEGVDAFAPPAPSDPRTVARCRLAMVQFAQGRTTEAQETVNEALNLDPTEPYALASLTLFSLLQELQDVPSIYLDRARELIARAKPDKQHPYVHSPTSGYVLFVSALQLVSKDRFDPALEILDTAASLDPALQAACGVLKGRCYQSTGKRTNAARSYLASAQAERGASLDLLRGRLGRVKLAGVEEASLALIARNPYHAQARLVRSRARLAAGKAKEALSDVSQALELNPHIQAAYLQRALLYLRDLPQELRSPDKGAQDVEAALALEGSVDRAEMLYAQALSAWLSGDAEASRKHLQDCLQENADYAWGWELRARHLANLGKKAEADEARAKFEALQNK